MRDMICKRGTKCVYYFEQVLEYTHVIKDGNFSSTTSGTKLHRECKNPKCEHYIYNYVKDCKWKVTRKLDKWSKKQNE